MISVAWSSVKVTKMKWAGMIPAATLWESSDYDEIGKRLLDQRKPSQRPLDAMINKLIDCRSAAQVVARLSGEEIDARDVLQRYAVTLQAAPRSVIRDVSELPYPKPVIKAVLRHSMNVSEADKPTLEWLRIAYLALADFQPLTKEEQEAVTIMGGLTDLSAQEAAQRVNTAGDKYVPVLKKSQAEAEALAKELGLLPEQR